MPIDISGVSLVPPYIDLSGILIEYEDISWNITDSPVIFYLSALETTIQLDASGVTDSSYAVLFQCDAEATIDVSATVMQNIFKYSITDQFLADASNDIRFYVDNVVVDTFSSTPISKSTVDRRPMTTYSRNNNDILSVIYPSPDQFITRDFVRYLGYYCFGNHLGSNLFTNEQDLVNSVHDRFFEGFQNTVINKLYSISTNINSGTILNLYTSNTIVSNSETTLWAVGGSISDPSFTTMQSYTDNDSILGHYLPNSETSPENICRELYNKLSTVQPGRFNNIVLPLSDPGNHDVLQTLPLMAGDIICFKTTINVAPDQSIFGNSGTDGNGVENERRKFRTYLIKLHLV
jgi:hypothetical protein